MIRIEGSVEEFYEWLLPVAAVADETRVFIGPEGIKIKVVDPANVIMIDMDLPKSAFYDYEVDETLKAGFDLCEIKGMFESTEDSELAVMNIITSSECHKGYPEVKVSTLELLTEGGLVNSVSTLPPESLRKAPELPSMDYTAHFKMTRRLFKKILDMANRTSDYIELKAEKVEDVKWQYRLTALAEGDRSRRFRAVLDSGSEDVGCVACVRDSASLYSLDYLREIVDAIKSDKSLSMDFGQDWPLTISFEVLNGGTAKYSIAPRVESE